VHNAAQKICDMNLANMSTVDGQAKRKADEARLVVILLVISGALLATTLIILTGRAILQPLRTLTDSVREIQKGNLNIILQPRSKDEVGQLTEAFNEMTAQLREYRRGEHAKLMRTEHSTQSVIDTLSDAVAILNTLGVVELSNQTAQELFELRPDVNVTTRKDDLLRRLFFSALLVEQSSEQFSVSNAIQVFEKGEERFFVPHAIPVIGENRNVIGVTVVFADVTRLRRVTELEVEPISVVSHELKTPLTSVRMALHMLFDDRIGTLNTKQIELLSAARDDSERLNKIIENLLDISKIESGHVALEMKPCSVFSLTTQAVNSFAAAFRSAGVELVTHIADDISEVLADPSRIAHVYSNLLSNALKFSSSGSTVAVSASVDGDKVKFSVTDQGVGISPDQLSRVFEKFFRGSSSDRSGGAGLGLAIAKEIVEAHGGKIWVDSMPGKGSVFSFTLSLA
jgi:signal transduction histidine kinase/HAMP domain-containing protein